jgi:hypothetical protein
VDEDQNACRERSMGGTCAAGEGDLSRYLHAAFPIADVTLLCCFDAGMRTEQRAKRLRRALIDAGFAPGAAGYLIRNSPLLYRSSRRGYRIQPFVAAPPSYRGASVPPSDTAEVRSRRHRRS